MSDLKRKEFESWFLINAKWYGNRDCLEFCGEEYSDGSVQLAFDAWQASRECLVIDLEPDDPADEGAAYLHQDFVKERIQSLGLKVKP